MQIEIKIEMTAWDGKTHCFFDTTGFQLMGSYDAENLLFCTTRTRGNVEIFVAVVPTVFLEELFKKFVVIHQVEWFLRDVTPYQFSHCSAFCPDIAHRVPCTYVDIVEGLLRRLRFLCIRVCL